MAIKFILSFVIAVVSFFFTWLLEGFFSLPFVKWIGFETSNYTNFFFVLLIISLVITIVYFISRKKSNKEWKGIYLIYVMVALYGAILGNFPNLSEGKDFPYNHISYYKRFDECAIINYSQIKNRTENDYSYFKGLVTISGDVLIPKQIVSDPSDDYYFGSFLDNKSGTQLYFSVFKKCGDNKTTISIFENGKRKYQYIFYEEKEDLDSRLSTSKKERIFKELFNDNFGTLLQIEEGGYEVIGKVIDWDTLYFK